jgi:16S rRNA G966 N2-methylase RsmD
MGDKFDYVFLDPPYQEGAAKVAIETIFSLGLLAEQGRVYLEHAEKLPPMIETPLAKLKQTKRYGTCAVSIYERADDETKPE